MLECVFVIFFLRINDLNHILSLLALLPAFNWFVSGENGQLYENCAHYKTVVAIQSSATANLVTQNRKIIESLTKRLLLCPKTGKTWGILHTLTYIYVH